MAKMGLKVVDIGAISEWADWGLKSLLGGAVTVGFLKLNRIDDKIDEAHDKIEEHKLYDANTYAKDSEVSNSFIRLENSLIEVRRDIKELLKIVR